MNPGADNTTGLGLPQPSLTQGQVSDAPESLSNHEQVSGVNATPSPRISGLSPNASTQDTLAQNAALATAASNDSTTDDSSDALDEQWVTKAKAIVEQTKADPYRESNELNKTKADYLRIRYNKQIKVNEDQQQ